MSLKRSDSLSKYWTERSSQEGKFQRAEQTRERAEIYLLSLSSTVGQMVRNNLELKRTQPRTYLSLATGAPGSRQPRRPEMSNSSLSGLYLLEGSLWPWMPPETKLELVVHAAAPCHEETWDPCRHKRSLWLPDALEPSKDFAASGCHADVTDLCTPPEAMSRRLIAPVAAEIQSGPVSTLIQVSTAHVTTEARPNAVVEASAWSDVHRHAGPSLHHPTEQWQ